MPLHAQITVVYYPKVGSYTHHNRALINQLCEHFLCANLKFVMVLIQNSLLFFQQTKTIEDFNTILITSKIKIYWGFIDHNSYLCI